MLHWLAGNDTAKAMIVRTTMTSKLSQAGRKILFPLFLSGWMVSCSPLNPFGWAQDYLDIAKLTEVSNQRTVNVQGIVVNVAPFLEGGAYQIQDKTGRVWVKTDRQLPKKGTVLSIRGEVAFEPIFIGPEKLGESYLVEITAPQPEATASNESNGDTNAPAPTTAAVSTAENTTTVEVIETEVVEEVPDNGTGETTEVPQVNGAIEVVESASEEETTASSPSNGAADLTPSGGQPSSVPVANPEAIRPIANSATTQPATPARPNLDDQFLPHKRFAK